MCIQEALRNKWSSTLGDERAFMGRQYQTGEAVDAVLSDSFDLVGQVDMGDHWEATFDFNAMLFNHGTAPETTVDFVTHGRTFWYSRRAQLSVSK